MMRVQMKIALTSVSLITLGSPAFAQEASSSDASANGEIIVQARRRDESVQDVPVVVNAVTADQIQKLNFREFAEIQNVVPGLLLSATPSGTGGNGQIRGVQYDINAGANPSIAFYQNDSLIDPSILLQAMYDVGDIQVLRGPQGTLRGQASPSGSIVVTTHKPDLDQFGGYTSMTGNNIGSLNFNGGVGVPIIPGIAAIRVAGVWDENEGNRVRTIATSGDLRDPFVRTASGRASLRVEPTDWLRLEGVYQHSDRRSRQFDQYASNNQFNPAAPASATEIDASDRKSIQESPRTYRQNFDVYNWRAEVHQLGQALIYQGSLQDSVFKVHANQDNANFLVGRDVYQDTTTKTKITTHEVRLQSEQRVFDIFDYTLGYYRNSQALRVDITAQTPVLLPLAFTGGQPVVAAVASTPISITRDRNITENSFFGNLTAHLGEKTEISGGARHIRYRNPPSLFTVAGNPIPQPAQKDDAWIYSASIKHDFTRDLMIYASTGTSRRPGPNVIGDFSVARSSVENSFLFLPPEKSTSYEVGIKSRWLDERLTLNLTAYHQKFRNYAFRNPTGIFYINYNATLVNGAVNITPTVSQFNFVAPVPVEVNGLEGELRYSITPRWNIGVVASYALGRIKNGLAPCNDSNSDGKPDLNPVRPTLAQLQALAGANNLQTCRISQRSSFQSPFSATVQSDFTQPISGKTDGFLRGLVTINGDSRADPQFQFDDYKGYVLANVYAGIRDPEGAWELSLFAKNLFDITRATQVGSAAYTDYQVLAPPTYRTTVGATAFANYAQITTTPPREFGLNFRYAFGSR